MTRTVNAAGRLDRLPVSRFHWKILGLIAGGAFLDAFAPPAASPIPAACDPTDDRSRSENRTVARATRSRLRREAGALASLTATGAKKLQRSMTAISTGAETMQH